MTHTAPRDQPAQEKVQTRKTVDDLKTLQIIANGFYPSRYVFEWKHGMVRVGWRLREGSVSGPYVFSAARLVDWLTGLYASTSCRSCSTLSGLPMTACRIHYGS